MIIRISKLLYSSSTLNYLQLKTNPIILAQFVWKLQWIINYPSHKIYVKREFFEKVIFFKNHWKTNYLIWIYLVLHVTMGLKTLFKTFFRTILSLLEEEIYRFIIVPLAWKTLYSPPPPIKLYRDPNEGYHFCKWLKCRENDFFTKPRPP